MASTTTKRSCPPSREGKGSEFNTAKFIDNCCCCCCCCYCKSEFNKAKLIDNSCYSCCCCSC